MKGIQKDGYTLYKGVPYAKAGRLEVPVQQALDPDLEALHWPPMAWQAGFEPGTFYDKEFYAGQKEPEKSEDCLYLNLWVPDQAEQAPVAFWIHGGGFDHGYSYEKEFDGAAYAKAGIILVTIQYRVGILGFWPSDTPSGNNLGIRDQLCALHWVYDNIGYFGGDQNNITIFGQSAGCMSVECLLMIPEAGKMISKAILQSGLGIPGPNPSTQAFGAAEAFLQEFSLTKQDLLRLPAQRLIDYQTRFLESHPLAFVPMLDGELFTEPFDKAPLADVPMLFGSTLNDIFTDPTQLASGVRGLIYAGCLALGKRLEQQGQKVYMYDFVRQLPGDAAGAFHSSELWYVFKTMDVCWRPWTKGDYALAERISSAWVSFMKTGDPGWKPWPFIEILDVEEETIEPVPAR